MMNQNMEPAAGRSYLVAMAAANLLSVNAAAAVG